MTTETGDVGGAKPGELSDDELKKGIMIGRVSRRVAGGQRIFRQKVMPDSEEPGKFVLVQRDPDSGEMKSSGAAIRRTWKRTGRESGSRRG